MLQPVMHILKQKNIILASGSPRRKEIIENIGLKVRLCPSQFEEDLEPKNFASFSEFVEETALQKVLEVENWLIKEESIPDVLIGADTMVTLDGEMFGKPTSVQEAFEMLSNYQRRDLMTHEESRELFEIYMDLCPQIGSDYLGKYHGLSGNWHTITLEFVLPRELSGRSHTVYTGVVVKTPQKTVKFTEKTNVVFGKVNEEQIKGYIATGEPMDKAGGYGIQGAGGTFVERVEGDYFTVVGLPLYRLCSVLYELHKE